MNPTELRVAREVERTVSKELERLGLLFRIFSRTKAPHSIAHKLKLKNYRDGGSKMRDIIGVRATLYFADDTDIARRAIKARLRDSYLESTIDTPEENLFAPKRINMVFRLNKDHASQVEAVRYMPDTVDATFELQLRTVLSEGWHEVEHDLRYKCKEDWEEDQRDLSRTLNGLFATLETCDWSMLQVFDELSLRHYRSANWSAMLRSKFRLRFHDKALGPQLAELISSNQRLARAIFRVDRRALLLEMSKLGLEIPITMDNIVFIANGLLIDSPDIWSITPGPVKDDLEHARMASNLSFPALDTA